MRKMLLAAIGYLAPKASAPAIAWEHRGYTDISFNETGVLAMFVTEIKNALSKLKSRTEYMIKGAALGLTKTKGDLNGDARKETYKLE